MNYVELLRRMYLNVITHSLKEKNIVYCYTFENAVVFHEHESLLFHLHFFLVAFDGFLCLLYRLLEPWQCYWLDEIVHNIQFERFDGIVSFGCREDDEWPVIAKLLCEVEARYTRH